MSNNLNNYNTIDDGINNNKLSINDMTRIVSIDENSTEKNGDEKLYVNINNKNDTEAITEYNQQLKNENNNEKRKKQNVSFNNEPELINYEQISKNMNTNKDVDNNDNSNNNNINNNNNMESSLTNNNSEITEDLSLKSISDIKVDENFKNNKISLKDNNEQLINKDESENDDINKIEGVEENTNNGNKRIILKLSEANNASDNNNILELEVDQLNNIDQIRFIIKIASNFQEQYILKYGFISKYVFYSKYHILHVDQHVRLPSHFTEGKIRASEIKSSLNLINTQRKRHLYTMAILNNSNIVNVMDIDGSSNVNHVLTAKLKEKLSNYVLLEKVGHYAVCSNSTVIEIFNSKFELNTFFHTEFNVYILKYNNSRNELIAIGAHKVNFYSLDIETNGKSSQTIVVQKLRLEYNTELPDEEWIKNVYLNEPTSKIYLILKKMAIVVDIETGKEIKRFKNKSNKFITCITSYNPFVYDIIGIADGSIQIRNSSDDLLHMFNNHTNAITGLEIVPGKPAFLSASFDGSIRLFNLVNFQEIYKLYLKEPSYGLKIIDENQFLTYSEREVILWNFNNITDCFTSLKSPPLSLEFSKNFNCPNRVVCRTLDGGIRLISPITGEIITTAIPYIDNEVIKDVLYSPALNYLYILKYDGEIWIYSTLTNPCSVIDIWKECKKENITCAKLYEDFLIPDKSLTGFSLLICGTNNGRIIFLGEYGATKFKYMAHSSEVTCLCINTEKKYLISGGKDYTINITELDFNLKKIIKNSITIATSFIPCLISNINNIICTSSDDFSIHTIEFNIDKKESKEIINHDKMDDHTDIIRAICPIKRLELFVTVSQDKGLKIWDYDNCLVKDILFQDSMCAICCIDNTLDLLIGISDRIDILKASEYLPSGVVALVQVLNKYYSTPLEYEEAIPFSDDINILKSIKLRDAPKYYDISAFERKKENIFSNIDLVAVVNKIIKRKLKSENGSHSHDHDLSSYFNFTDICESLEKFNVTASIKLDEENDLTSVFCEPDELEGFNHLRNLGLIRESYSVLNLSEDKDIIFFNSFNDLSIMTIKKNKKKKMRKKAIKKSYTKKLHSATNKILGFVKLHISLNQSLKKSEFEGSPNVDTNSLPMIQEKDKIDKIIEDETIQEQIDSAINYSKIITSNAIKCISNTKLDGVQDLIFIEEYQKYSKYKSFLGKEDDFETNLGKPVLYLNPTSPNQSLFMDFNHNETEFSYENYNKQIKEFTRIIDDDDDYRMIAIKKKKEAEIKKQNDLKSKRRIKEKTDTVNNSQQIAKIKKPPKYTVPIAPDGYIPNSIIMKVINEWKKLHPEFIICNYNEFKSNSEFDLIREFDRKMNDISNIKNEKELINEIIEKFRQIQNQKKIEEIEKVKQNNIKLHTEFSSLLFPQQSSFQQNRFLNKYFNGIMPTINGNDKNENKEEEENETKKNEEEDKKKEEEINKKNSNISQYIKSSTIQNMSQSKNMTRTSTVMSNTDSNNKFLAIKYLNDDIDIKDKTKKNSAIDVIDENTEDNSDEEEEDNSSHEEDEDISEEEINSQESVRSIDDEENNEEDEEEVEEEDENIENDDAKLKNEEQISSNSQNIIDKSESKEKKYLYYTEDDIPEEIQTLINSFWFPKTLIFENDVNLIRRDEFSMMEECSTEKILPKIFKIFMDEGTDKFVKFEIIDYLKYYDTFKSSSDESYSSNTIINFFCNYLKTKWNEDIENDEINLRLKILDSLCEYDRGSPEFLLTLLFLLNSKNEIIKQAVIHHLEILNLSSILNSSLVRKIKKFFYKKKKNDSSSNINKTTQNENEDNNDFLLDDKNYIPAPIEEICNSISEILQGLLKKFLLYINIPPRFKETIKNMNVQSLSEMNKKYSRSVNKEITKELENNPEGLIKIIEHSCYSLDTNEISNDNRYEEFIPKSSNFEMNRHPLIIMISPTTFDYIPSIIHYLKLENKYLSKKENEQRIAMEKQRKREEEKQIELERRNLYNKFMEEREKKYKERLEQRRQRVLEAAESKTSESLLHLPSIPKNRKKFNIKSSARFGETHCSKCHPSRETVCYPLHAIPEGSVCERCLRRFNQVDLHFNKMYKSLPYGIIQSAPFIESNNDQMNSRVADIQKSILDAMEKSKSNQENKYMYGKLGRVNKFVTNHQQQAKILLRDINLQKKRITNQIILEQQKYHKYNDIPIHKFDTKNTLKELDMDLISPRLPLTEPETIRNMTNVNQQTDNQFSTNTTSSEYWTSKRYFIPMFSYNDEDNNDIHHHHHHH